MKNLQMAKQIEKLRKAQESRESVAKFVKGEISVQELIHRIQRCRRTRL